MSYVTTTDVYNAANLNNTIVSKAAVESFIKGAEKEVDLWTNTTYWSLLESATADSGTTTTLVDSDAAWTTNQYAGNYVWIYGGTGSGQIVKIESNNTTTLTFESAVTTAPDGTSTYRIFYSATDPNINDSFDGTNNRVYFVEKYPIRQVDSLAIDGTSVTISNVYQYSKQGKLQLGDDAEATIFANNKPQQVALDYWFGVYPIPEEVKRYVILRAALGTLGTQAGGTYNTPSTYQLPEGSVTIGQAYVNIRGTYDMLQKELQSLKPLLKRYPFLG